MAISNRQTNCPGDFCDHLFFNSTDITRRLVPVGMPIFQETSAKLLSFN